MNQEEEWLLPKVESLAQSQCYCLFLKLESGKFSGALPLSYYNGVGAALEEKYDTADQEKASLGRGTVNNNTFCFPTVIRSSLPGGVKVCLVSVLNSDVVRSSLTISGSNAEHPGTYLVGNKYHGIQIIIGNVEGNSSFDLTVPTDVNAMCIFIQEKFDQTFGHSWNIICGEAFSSSLTFQVCLKIFWKKIIGILYYLRKFCTFTVAPLPSSYGEITSCSRKISQKGTI